MDHSVIYMDFFWTELEEFGTINVYLKRISRSALEARMLKLNNQCSQNLARLERETIILIEENMRGMVESLKEASAGGIPLRDIYGRNHALQPENFQFTE